MPPDFDEKAGYDVIKDSMGLTDADLAPEDGGMDLEGGEEARKWRRTIRKFV
jgi:hypothetical protein